MVAFSISVPDSPQTTTPRTRKLDGNGATDCARPSSWLRPETRPPAWPRLRSSARRLPGGECARWGGWWTSRSSGGEWACAPSGRAPALESRSLREPVWGAEKTFDCHPRPLTGMSAEASGPAAAAAECLGSPSPSGVEPGSPSYSLKPLTPNSKYVKLNVGGSLHYTTLRTLTGQDTMLKAMFSGRVEVLTDAGGMRAAGTRAAPPAPSSFPAP